jgi:Skp family chaperone for outer membrane proteins
VKSFAPRLLAASLPALALCAFGVSSAYAQSKSPGYFIPHKAAAPVSHMAAPVAASSAASPVAPQQPTQPKLPPIPNLPALPKEAPPPAAIIGVLSVPEIMQQSTAARGVETIIQQRRTVLAKEAQAEQKRIEAEQKTIEAEKAKLTKPVLVSKEKALQVEIEKDQVKFHNQGVAIEISARTALGKIESTLIAVIRQVAQAHDMNLVLHRSQVALNSNKIDISTEVATQLNKILPSVAVPPSIVPKSVAAAQAAPPKK